MAAPTMQRQAHALEEERVLAGLVHHGPLTFRTIRRKVLPNATYAVVGNAIRRLHDRKEVETFRLRGGPATWRITNAGRLRLKLPPVTVPPAVTQGTSAAASPSPLDPHGAQE